MRTHVLIKRLLDIPYQSRKCIKLGKGAPYFIHPKYVKKDAVVYSAGVGNDISFETDLIKKCNAHVFLFDPSPTGVEFMKDKKHKNMSFFPLGLSGESGKKEFNHPDNPAEGSFTIVTKGKDKEKKSESFQCVTIHDFMKKNNHKHIDLLKIDIEGFEYEVLKDMLDNGIEPTQICVEFHDWQKAIPKSWTKNTIKRLKHRGYKMVYRDVDNYTFVKK